MPHWNQPMPFIPVKRSKKKEPKPPKPRHVHVMRKTTAGSWRCVDPVCKRVSISLNKGEKKVSSTSGETIGIFGGTD